MQREINIEELFLIVLGVPYNPNAIAQGVKLWVYGYDGELISLNEKTVEIWGGGNNRKEDWQNTFTLVEDNGDRRTFSKEQLIVISKDSRILWKGNKARISEEQVAGV